VTPDNKNVVYLSSVTIWMLPLGGGTPSRLADVPSSTRVPALSPDGMALAFVALGDGDKPAITVCSLPGCTAPRRLTPPGLTMTEPDGGPIRWTTDSKGIAYVNVAPRPNIWIQPVDGSAPRQFTRFTDGRSIPDFAWSRDGARLAIVRATSSTDIVLFKGLRSTNAEPEPRN
jgi:Tol biopolymer transport system component